MTIELLCTAKREISEHKRKTSAKFFSVEPV
jgi:hypothetical protein